MSDRIVSYRPGSWLAIVGEQAIVALPASEKARAGALWAAVDDGAGFDAVLDTLLAGGLSTLPGFVLVATGDDPAGSTTRAVVRGDASASFETADGKVVVQGAVDAMWAERTLRSVTSYVVTLPDQDFHGSEEELTVESGLVRASAIAWPRPGSRRRSLAPVVSLPAPEDEAPEESAPEPEASWAPPSLPPPPAPPVGLPPAPPVPVPPVPPPPFPPAAEPTEEPSYEPERPADGFADDYAGDFTGGDYADDALTEQMQQVEPEPAWAPSGAVAHLSFSSGEEIDVDRLVVIGRAPDAGRFAPDDEPLLVQVPSPHSEISATHVEVRPGSGDDHRWAFVTDLGSTNGTLVVEPGERPEELRPGVPVRLQVGTMIDLGDGLTIRVTEP